MDVGNSFLMMKGGVMIKIPIDLWLKYGRKMEVIGNRVLELARDTRMDVEPMEVEMRMWNMILTDMEIVQAGKNLGGEFQVI